MCNLPSMSPEERKRNLEKAKETRLAAVEYAKEHQRDVLASDLVYWRAMAKKRGVRLPVAFKMITPKEIKGILRKLNIPISKLYEIWGCKNLTEIVNTNPNMGAAEFMGIMLEELENNPSEFFLDSS